ncbi:hypothetical protein M8494_08265 [Serratia ureilytica]
MTAGHQVVGIDNLNDYMTWAKTWPVWTELADKPGSALSSWIWPIAKAWRHCSPSISFSASFIWAQAGVRYSLVNPLAYADANLIGHLNVLEGCRHNKVEHLLRPPALFMASIASCRLLPKILSTTLCHCMRQPKSQ